jgi:uncharacterized protein
MRPPQKLVSWILVVFGIMLVCLLVPGWAQTQAEDPLQGLTPRGYVNDFAGVIGPGPSAQLGSLLSELDRKTGAQLSVVTITSLQDQEIRDFSNRLFERWGIGHKDDRGLLMLMAVKERRIWVEVGYGLEPLLPDARVGRILDESVIPFFKSGDYAAGLSSGAQRFAEIIAQNSGVQLNGLAGVRAPTRVERQERPLTCGEAVFFFFVLIAGGYLFIRHPWLFLLLLSSGGRGSGGFGGGFGGGGFGGFGGGSSGGGGAGRGW